MVGWWVASSPEALEEAEKVLLSGSPNLIRYDVPTQDGCHIHTLEDGIGLANKTPLVLLHGYGQGAAAYFMNLRQLAANVHVYSTDWCGFGLSARPILTCVGVRDVEDFFCIHLEKWREAKQLERMILCGHSLGGYLSVAYAERYPQRVEKLILASPVGVPELTPEIDARKVAAMTWRRRTFLGPARWLWSKGVTPQDLIRSAGPVGKMLTESYLRYRFEASPNGTTEEKEAFGQYLYHNAAATHGSGERALSQLLKPGAYAYEPLCNRIPKLEKNFSIHFIYGSCDCMDDRHAQALKKLCPEHAIEVDVIPNVGHQVFLDTPQEFNNIVLRICGIAVEQIKPAPSVLREVETEVAELPMSVSQL